jgi:hypothetical protein
MRVFFKAGLVSQALDQGTSLARMTQQQVQVSGLLPHLPALFAAAAAQLADAGADQAGAPASSDISHETGLRSSFLRDAFALEACLLETWVPGPGSSVLQDLSASIVAVLPLVMTSMQWISGDVHRMLQQQRQQPGGLWDVEQTMRGVREVQYDALNDAERCVCAVTSQLKELNNDPDVQLGHKVLHIVLSPDLLRCLFATLAWVSFRELREAHRSTPSSSSGSSTGKSRRSSSSRRSRSMSGSAAAGHTQQQQQQHGHAGVDGAVKQQGDKPLPRLTPSNVGMLQLLGIHADALEWIEHDSRDGPRCRGFMFVLLMAYTFVTSKWADHASQLPIQQLLLLTQMDALLPGKLPHLLLS